MGMMLWIDTETFSETPITHGTYRYTADCEVMLITYAIDDGPVQCWDATGDDALPRELSNYLGGDGLITAHNAMFDRNAMLKVWPTRIDRWRDTMVQALAHGLPGSLGTLSDLFKLGDSGKKAGKDYIHLFCKPRPAASKLRRATRLTHPQEWAEFIEYAKADVVAMRILASKLPKWNWGPEEVALWHLDQRINDRGMAVDKELAEAMLAAVDVEQLRLKGEVDEHTNGEVGSATQRDEMLEHILSQYGVSLPDLKKATVERRLADEDIPEPLKELLRLRLMTATTSTAKYKALLKGLSDDGRLRGTIQFNGAARTRRAGGRVFQPQNLPSRGLLPPEDISLAIEAVKIDSLPLFLPNTMHAASSCIRACIVPAKGKKLVVADLANIEGRMAAWLAGEEWKLQAFRDYDTVISTDAKGKALRKGPDLYNVAYAKAFGIPVALVTDTQRSVGKVMELMLQYAGGVGAFVTGAASYKIDLETMADGAWDSLPAELIEEATGFLAWMEKKDKAFSPEKKFRLSPKAFIVCDVFKRAWRAANPAISSYWKEIERAVVAGMVDPGTVVPCRKMSVAREGAWLTVILPSGRRLCYPSPQLDSKGALSYMGSNPYTKKWERIHTHGGKLLENACQATARDVMFDAMPSVEEAGYQIILSVHDELVTEVPVGGDQAVDGLCRLLAAERDWSVGLPLAAAGKEMQRYGKG